MNVPNTPYYFLSLLSPVSPMSPLALLVWGLPCVPNVPILQVPDYAGGYVSLHS